MKIISKRHLGTIVFALTFAFLFIFHVYAAPAAVWYSNFAGVTTAKAEKDVSYTSPNTFYCFSRSYTDQPVIRITHLGYNTFSCTVWKNGIATGWSRPTGKANWNSSYQVDSGSVLVSFTQGQSRKVTAAGSHDFGHFNGQTYDWDPSLSATGNYP